MNEPRVTATEEPARTGYTLIFNKSITKVFKQNTWDVHGTYDNMTTVYASRWVVERLGGYCLAYNKHGKTHYCDPMPTKEEALRYMQALEIANKIEGNDQPYIYPQGALCTSSTTKTSSSQSNATTHDLTPEAPSK